MRNGQLHDSRTATAGRHAILIALSFLAIFPFYWMLNTSFKPQGEVYSPSLLRTTGRSTITCKRGTGSRWHICSRIR